MNGSAARENKYPLFRYPNPSSENLPELSRLAHSASRSQCAECRNYHVMWPYLRSIGANGGGPEYCWSSLGGLLEEEIGARGRVRWGLAGSADAGLLALVADRIRYSGRDVHDITIVDRCRTPLIVCDAFARSAGIDIQTVVVNLLDYRPDANFDIVILHHLLGFFPENERLKVVRCAAQWLEKGGRIFLSISHGEHIAGYENRRKTRREWRRELIAEAVSNGELVLPEDRAVFLDRLDHMTDWKPRSARKWTIADYLTLIDQAGLSDVRVVDLPFSEAEVDALGGHLKQRSVIIATLP